MKRLKNALLAVGLMIAPVAAAQSVPFPTYQVGPQSNGTFVVSDGTIITPSGTQVNLGCGPAVNSTPPVCAPVRAKAVAVNPLGNQTAAVLIMGTHGATGRAVMIFNTVTGAVLQNYSPFGSDSDGSAEGLVYTPDGLHLLFSQDGNYGPTSFVAIANVNASTGLLSDNAQVLVPLDVNAEGQLTNVTCFNNSPGGTSGSFLIPCGFPVSIFSDDTYTSYPTGIAVTADGKTAYAVLDNNDTLTKIDLTGLTAMPPTAPVQGAEIRVGNVPHSVVISPDGTTAYVSNEAGRIANQNDFQEYSNGTPVVAEYPTGSVANGTISVVNLSKFKVTGSIPVGHHPTGMAFWGKFLLVANTYDDTISVIDPTFNQVVNTISVGLPISVPGQWNPAYGAGPNSIAVDNKKGIAYVALYNANAVAVVNLNSLGSDSVLGMIPVAYAPASVVLDTTDGVLLVANDKGWGTTGNPNPFNTVSGAPITDNFTANYYGAIALNTHQDLGTVSIIPVPTFPALWGMTQQVYQNNHWDLFENIASASGGSPWARPVAIPQHIGDPSLIKHVFVIIRENRTYDQILGDVAGGNGDASLAVFGDNSAYGAPYPVVTPNAHALVQRFPLLDNFYDPSRQSADGHNWITQAIAPYSDDIQSPDWLRDYPSNGGDALAYQQKGHLWDTAAAAGVTVKNYGEYIEYNTFTGQRCTPDNYTQANYYNGPGFAALLPFRVTDSSKCEPSWNQFYNDTLLFEAGLEPQLQYYNLIGSVTPLPNLAKITVPNFPQFDLGIPDQYRVDVWEQDFANDLAHGTVPQLEFLWIMSDHTTGPPSPTAEQADNDLAVGRVIDLISHSRIWSSSAIFIEEDDAQNGVDHVDGHRSPGYVISPYVVQVPPAQIGTGTVHEDGTFYTQVNMTRTIEQILGITPMNQNDLVASPMRTLFVDNPPASNFAAWSHVPNQVPLCYGVANYVPPPANIYPPSFNTCANVISQLDSPAVKALRAGWLKMKTDVFAAKYHVPDSLDPDTVSHYDWYEATGYKVPFPGETKVRPASDFRAKVSKTVDVDD